MLKEVLVFCQKSDKIMLFFLKVLVGYIRMLTFSDFFKHRILHFLDFQLHFSFSALAGCRPLFLDDNVDDAILERV